MHREQQPVEPLHERRRLRQLPAVRQRRLIEQQHRQVVEGRGSSPVDSIRCSSGCVTLISSTGLAAGTFWPAASRIRRICAPRSCSPSTRHAGESASRFVTRTSLTRSCSAFLMRSTSAPCSFDSVSRCCFLFVGLDRADVELAARDVAQLLAVELAQVIDQPLVDAIREQQHFDALAAQDFEVRAGFRGREAVGDHEVDLLLPRLHARDVVLERHVLLRLVRVRAGEAQQLGDALAIGVILGRALP